MGALVAGRRRAHGFFYAVGHGWTRGAALGLADDHALVRARTPIHGAISSPASPGFARTCWPAWRPSPAWPYPDGGLALSLGKGASYFADRCTSGPLILFRMFKYPSPPTLGRRPACAGVCIWQSIGSEDPVRQRSLREGG
jgi:hypothetical protein